MAQIINLRTCFYSKKKYLPKEMVRFIIENDQIVFKKTTKRGYYLKIEQDTNLESVAKKIFNYFHLKDLQSIIAALEQITK